MLVVMVGVRKLLDRIFTKRELKILDDLMPVSTKNKQNKIVEDAEVAWDSKFVKFKLNSK